MGGKIKNIVIKVVLLILCLPLFLLGDFLLNDISTRYQIFLGSTFHVVLGCTLMAVSVVYISYTLYRLLFAKRKRMKRSKPFYFKKEENKPPTK